MFLTVVDSRIGLPLTIFGNHLVYLLIFTVMIPIQ